MKKLRANAILSAFIFGVSILLLCSFGTDTAYIILSRYKLQKIANAAAIEYAATRGRDTTFSETSNSDCTQVRQKLNLIYNRIISGVTYFNIDLMEEKTNSINKEIVVKVEATSMVTPAFLRFVGAGMIYLHANAYAKTNTLEITKEMDYILDPNQTEHYEDEENLTYVTFSSPFTDDNILNREAEIVTAKANLNGDFAINLSYETTPSESLKGGGFFVFAGYDDINGVINWVDVGDKIKNTLTNNTTIDRICNQNDANQCYFCVNGNNGSNPKTVTFDMTQVDAPGASGHINRFKYLRIYKAGLIAGTQIGDTIIDTPCDMTPLALPPSGGEDSGGTTPPVGPPPPPAPPSGGTTGDPTTMLPGKGMLVPFKNMLNYIKYSNAVYADDDDINPPGAPDASDGENTGSNLLYPKNIFTTPATVKLYILNNVSLISGREYNNFMADGAPKTCAVSGAPAPSEPTPPEEP